MTDEVRQASPRREKMALVIFIMLMVLGGALLSSYFLTGRGWTVAATIVDDAAGSMDDYSVVVFSGVVEHKKDVSAKTSSSSSSSTSSVQTTQSDSGDTALKGSSSASVDASNPGSANAVSPVEEQSEAHEQVEVVIDEEDHPVSNMLDALGSSDDNAAGGEIGERIMSIYQRADKQKASAQDEVFVSDIRDLYELKGAKAMTIDLSNLSKYSEPMILKAGDKKFGVFSATSYASRAKLKKTVSELRKEGATCIICITPSESLVATFDGIDALVLTQPADPQAESKDKGNTFSVTSPYIGEVGVITFSSNNVSSYKVIDEL